MFTFFVLTKHTTFDLVRDVWHYLNGLSQIVAVALTVDDGLVDAPRGDAVVTRSLNACESLIVSQVEVCLHAICRHVAFAMLVGVQRPWVNVDIRVELLNGDFVAACLQQLSNAGGDDALS